MPITVSDAIAITIADLEQAFSAVFTNVDPIVLKDRHDGDPMVLVDHARGVATTHWRVEGDDETGAFGFLPTGHRIAIEGVSVIDVRAGDDSGRGIEVARFFDWSLVHAQLGSLPGRQVLRT